MLAVVRGELSEDDQKFALITHQYVPTPMAPELGLFLCECIYKAYNDKFGAVHDALQLSKYHDKVEAFKHSFVYTHIAKQEREEHTMREWIRDVLQGGKNLRAAFDAGIASSFAAGETLDASRVGVRQKKRKIDADASDAPPSGGSFEASMAAAAERAKMRKLNAPADERQKYNNSRPPSAKVAPAKKDPPNMIPLDEYSD
jgi:tRNA pseudouridine38-40 synthase